MKSPKVQMSELDEYLNFAKELAKEAGEIMSLSFANGTSREWKEDRTPVTEADTKINSLVIERIKAKYPDHGVWGEEESHNLGVQMTWVCDPVDGTMPFSHGLPISTFALALARDGQPIVGVVYDPFMKRMFYAAKGTGAYLNGDRIQVSDKDDLKDALLDEEGLRDSTKPVIPTGDGYIEELIEAGARPLKLWAVVLPSALVAAGEFTATIFNVPKPEDGAAIKIIVEEAGGKVTDLFGNEQRYDQPTKGYIASNGKVHQQLVDIIARHKDSQ